MKKLIFSAFMLLSSFSFAYSAPEVDFNLYTSSYAYNGENTQWEETRTTLTYFENFTEASFKIKFNELIDVDLGLAVLLPFTFEFPDNVRFFPIVTSRIGNDAVQLRIGTLKGGHNLPAPIRDPLIDMTPVVRSTIDNTLIKDGPETYKYNDKFTHGYYEYGASFEWFKGGRGEIYMNWQMLHTERHRERFDVGLTYALDFVSPIFTPYIGIHYWHNGGHEFPLVVNTTTGERTPAITENYTGAIGINSKWLSILYLASYNIPDRDNNVTQFGHGLYLRGTIPVKNWFEIEPLMFVSGWYLNHDHRFISVEGDPFFRVPFYAGLNIKKEFVFDNGISLSLGFINGIFLTETGEVGGRYDQTLSFNFTYNIPVTKR